MTARTFVGLRSVRPRAALPDLIVLHWTGGVVVPTKLDTDRDGIADHLDADDDGDGLPDYLDPDGDDIGSLARLYDVLRATTGLRTPDGLSVHVGSAPDGDTAHWVPDELVALHAGAVNPRALGLEGCSPGFSHIKGKLSRAWALEKARGIVRREYVDRIRGRLVRMLDYTAAQHEAVAHVVEAWCARWSIPRAVPTEADGSLMRRQMTSRELAAFRGVIGHYHCHETRCDPGTAPLLALARRWGLAVT